ncbi:hypothetical protein [Bacillus thuringiensis]|uniref:hypothetical protein n=1 Tax=Bacillus thuringiensis TaxID=1428 RepID=UPI0011A84775|nr:hypothetical protein [Bacillus thuringiensis]
MAQEKEKVTYNWNYKKIKDEPLFSEWLANQSNIAGTLNTLAQFSIRLLGTKDVEHFDSQKKLAELLLKQDEQFISEIVNKLLNPFLLDNNLIMHYPKKNKELQLDSNTKLETTTENKIIKQKESKGINEEDFFG